MQFRDFLTENVISRLKKPEEEIKKVSFDMDNTLSFNTYEGPIPREKYINLFKDHMKKGREVIIVTSRQESKIDREQILDFLDDNNLPSVDIYYTNFKLKAETLSKLGVDFHYDDDKREIDAIHKNTNIDYLSAFDPELSKLYQHHDEIDVDYNTGS